LTAAELTDEDVRILREISSMLGRTDAETQRSQLDEAIARLKQQLADAREKRPVQERLSLTVGTMAGVCLVILLL
jgi:stage III sporulation protein AB